MGDLGFFWRWIWPHVAVICGMAFASPSHHANASEACDRILLESGIEYSINHAKIDGVAWANGVGGPGAIADFIDIVSPIDVNKPNIAIIRISSDVIAVPKIKCGPSKGCKPDEITCEKSLKDLKLEAMVFFNRSPSVGYEKKMEGIVTYLQK
jgi:hypothetical protein